MKAVSAVPLCSKGGCHKDIACHCQELSKCLLVPQLEQLAENRDHARFMRKFGQYQVMSHVILAERPEASEGRSDHPLAKRAEVAEDAEKAWDDMRLGGCGNGFGMTSQNCFQKHR
jgi:hypothetical protein